MKNDEPSLLNIPLYDHHFDIDDIIKALCGDHHTGRWILDSSPAKQLIKETKPSSLKDGDKNGHINIIEPLPFSFIEGLKTHDKFVLLDDALKNEILSFLNAATSLHALSLHFEKDVAGAWIRDRVKDVALEWLERKNMIPPSMRHVRDRTMFQTIPNKPKIIIQ